MSKDLILYVGAEEDLYVSAAGFMVDGQPTDPTQYAASLSLVASEEVVIESAWTEAEWVADASPPLCKALFGNPTPLVAGTYWLYLKLQGTREKMPFQVCRVTVKATP